MNTIKHIIFLVVISITLINCKNTTQEKAKEEDTLSNKDSLNTEIAEEEEEILLGKIKRSQLEEAQYKDWFNERYKEYTVDSTQIAMLQKQLQDKKLTIYMGTWCSDSQREVPALFKILDQTNTQVDTLIAMTRDKTTPSNFEKNKNITNVPTIIIKKDGNEIGRIVEYPIQSLEKDMLAILEGKDYKHAYAE